MDIQFESKSDWRNSNVVFFEMISGEFMSDVVDILMQLLGALMRVFMAVRCRCLRLAEALL